MTDTKLTDLSELATTAAGDYAYVVDVSDTADDAAGSSRKVLLSNLLPADSVSYAKLQNVSATDKILGRATSGAGDVEEIACTAAGRALLDDADASAQRATLGLGTLATQGGTFSGASSGTNTGDQNVFSTVSVSGQSDVVADSTGDTLTLVAGSNVTITTDASADSVTISAAGGYATAQEEGSALTQRATINFVGSGLTAADDSGNSRTNVGVQATLNSLASDGSTSGTLEKTGATTVGTYAVTAAAKTVLDDASVSAMRTTLGVAIGTDVQAHDAELAALAGLASAADKVPYFTGSGTASLADFSPFGRSLADDADAAAARTTLGLGTLATQGGTFSGTSSGTNTGDQSLFSTISVSGQPDVVADSASDTLTLAAGSNITITTNASTDTVTIAATGGTPGGSDTQVQFNDGGSFGGDSALLWNKTSNQLTLAGSALVGSGTVSVGTSGVGVAVLGNSTAPTSAPADEVQLYAADYAAGDSRLHVYSESGAQLIVGNGTVETKAPASGAGNPLTVRASAAASGNTNGGDVLLLPGASAGSGENGKVIVRLPGGTAGVHEFQILVGATANAIYGSPNGTLNTTFGLNGSNSIAFGYTGSAVIRSGATVSLYCGYNQTCIAAALNWAGTVTGTHGDVGLSRTAAGVISLTNGAGTGSGPGGLAATARTPSQITADQNNYSPGVGLFQRWSSDASRNVTGMAAGQDGEERKVWNVGSQSIVIQNENASSTAANRFLTSTGADVTLAANRCALCQYDATTQRWRVALLP